MEEKMGANTIQRKTQKNFLDIPTAANEAGYSPRHFRRIIEEDGIPVLQIGRKFFIVAKDFEQWKSTKGEFRFQQAIQQLDRWLKTSPKENVDPVDELEDED
jgi:2,4-dienoyl-CoA reductase-like NADH-dependent reductase (Old Yellow Enzyme family)